MKVAKALGITIPQLLPVRGGQGDRVIDRRHLLILLGAAAVAPRKLFAQAKQPVLVGWLHGVSRQSAREAAFRQGISIRKPTKSTSSCYWIQLRRCGVSGFSAIPKIPHMPR